MRRHGFPFTVIPRHVEAGFRESERGNIDSGVLGNCGMPTVERDVVSKGIQPLQLNRISSCMKIQLGMFKIVELS